MKKLIWMGLILILRTSYGQSTAPAPQVLAGPFEWTGEAYALGGLNGQPLRAYVLEVHCLSLQTEAKTPAVYTLRTLGPAIVSQVTARRYAVVGHIQYSDVAPGTFLELENWFAPEQPGGPEASYYSRTLAEAGPMAKLEGSDDGHDFALPFDATGTKTRLSRLVLKMHIMGPGQIQISNVRLVQYPDVPPLASPAAGSNDASLYVGYNNQGALVWNLDGTDYHSLAAVLSVIQSKPATQVEIHPDHRLPESDLAALLKVCRDGGVQAVSLNGGAYIPVAQLLDAVPPKSLVGFSSQPQSPTIEARHPGLDGRSFLLGVLASFIGVLTLAGVVFVGHRFRRFRHARELRRIASLDG